MPASRDTLSALKVVLAILFLLHIFVHPVEHAPLPFGPSVPELSSPQPAESQARAQGPDVCLACRSASSLVATPVPLGSVQMAATWEKPRGPAYLLPDQPSFSVLSARAPPAL